MQSSRVRGCFWPATVAATWMIAAGCKTVGASQLRDAGAPGGVIRLGACSADPVICPTQPDSSGGSASGSGSSDGSGAGADPPPPMLTICTAVDGGGNPVASGQGTDSCYAGNDLQSSLCQMNPALNPPDYQVNCSANLLTDSDGTSPPTMAPLTLAGCGAADDACPADIVFGGLLCTATDDQGNVVATARGNNPCYAGKTLRATLCGMSPALDPTSLQATCIGGAGNNAVGPVDACSPVATLRCGAGFHPDTASCLQPDGPGGSGSSGTTDTAGADSSAYGRCIADAGVALSDEAPQIANAIAGIDGDGNPGTCATLAAGVSCQPDPETDQLIASCHGRGRRPALCNDCSVLCISSAGEAP